MGYAAPGTADIPVLLETRQLHSDLRLNIGSVISKIDEVNTIDRYIAPSNELDRSG